MRIAPVFEPTRLPAKDATEDKDTGQADDRRSEARRWNPIVVHLLDDFGDREEVRNALGANIMTFMWHGSRVPYFEQYAAPLETLVKHHRPAVAAWARRQLAAQRQLARQEQTREDEHAFGIF
jgi:hypothetical protein